MEKLELIVKAMALFVLCCVGIAAFSFASWIISLFS